MVCPNPGPPWKTEAQNDISLRPHCARGAELGPGSWPSACPPAPSQRQDGEDKEAPFPTGGPSAQAHIVGLQVDRSPGVSLSPPPHPRADPPLPWLWVPALLPEGLTSKACAGSASSSPLASRPVGSLSPSVLSGGGGHGLAPSETAEDRAVLKRMKGYTSSQWRPCMLCVLGQLTHPL